MQTSRRPTSRRIDNSRGFTLFEFLVVLLLLGLFVSLASVNWDAFGAKGKEGFLETFSLEVALLKEEAIGRYERRAIEFDLGNNSLTLGRIDGKKGYVSRKEFPLPRGYRLKNVSVNGEVFSTARPLVHFYPTGMVDRAIVHMERDGNEPYSIMIDPITARVTGREGYIEEIQVPKRNQSP